MEISAQRLKDNLEYEVAKAARRVDSLNRLMPFLNQLVIVRTYRFVSGASTIPFSKLINEKIGKLANFSFLPPELMLSPGNRFWLMNEDEDRTEDQFIENVYNVGEGFEGEIHIEGWLPDGIWGKWIVSK